MPAARVAVIKLFPSHLEAGTDATQFEILLAEKRGVAGKGGKVAEDKLVSGATHVSKPGEG